jgi:Diguanylate cyclase, GGDEF domain/Histidine kinase sensor domain
MRKTMIRIARSILAKPALFVFAGIGITLATTGVTAVSLYQMRLDAMAQASDAANNLVLSLQKETERNLDIYQLAMRDVVTSMETPSTLQLTPGVRHLFAFSAANNVKELGAIFATDAAGNSVLDSRWVPAPKLNVSDRDFFQVQQQQKGAGLYPSKPFVPRLGNSGQPAIALSLRLDDASGHFAGIVAGTLRLSYFHQLFEDSILGDHGTLTLLRTDGTVLMRQPYHRDDIGRTLAGGHSFPPLVQSDHGTYVDVAVLDHIERLYSFRRIGTYPLIVVVGLATGDIYAGWRKRAFAIGTVTAVLDALTIMLCLMFSGQLRKRFAMERQLQTLAWFDALTGLPNRAQLNKQTLRILTDASCDSSQFAILFIDLDRFKRVNDTQGHAAGDEVLQPTLPGTSCRPYTSLSPSTRNMTPASRSVRASASRCIPTTGRTPIPCCVMRTWRCTRPRAQDVIRCISMRPCISVKPKNSSNWKSRCNEPCKAEP